MDHTYRLALVHLVANYILKTIIELFVLDLYLFFGSLCQWYPCVDPMLPW